MKTVTLVRHAKSSWKEEGLPDIERPLNKRGKRDAPRMAERLAARGAHPELMISSPAKRARKTAVAFADALGLSPAEIRIDERVYHGDAADIMRVIHEQDDRLTHVLIVGHNPDLTDFVNGLASVSVDNVPTCGVVELSFDVPTWAEVGPASPVTVEMDYPKRDAPD